MYFKRDNIIQFNLEMWKYSCHTYGMHTKCSDIYIHWQPCHQPTFYLPNTRKKHNGFTDLELECITFASQVSKLKRETL